MVELAIIAGFLFILAIGDIIYTALMWMVNRYLNHDSISFVKYMKKML